MLKRVLKWFLGIFLVVLVVVSVFAANAIWFRPWFLGVFYEKVFIEFLFDEPELLSAIGLVEQFGITGHNARLNDESPAHYQQQFARLRRDIAQLHQYPLDKQSASERLSTAVLDWFLNIQAEAERFQFHDYPVNQLFGVQNQFPSFMANTHRLLAPQDCEYYVKRLDAVPAKFEGLLEGLKIREQKGIIPPRFVIDEVLKEMNEFVATPAGKNILATSFRERAAKIARLTDQERSDYGGRVEGAINGSVYPAYHKLIDYFAALQAKATSDDGVWKLPDGEAYYAYKLRESTTTTLNPQEVHSLGLSEVARIEGEMRALLDANGYSGQPIPVAMKALGKDARFQFPNDDAGRKASLAEYARLIDEALQNSKKIFVTLPKAKIDVRPVPEFKQATAPGAYYEPPALDGTRPGVFYANLRDMAELPRWSMPTLAYHEGVPGHHFQITTAQELKGVPQFRKLVPFTAYQEGWALYTEWLAKQAGWYDKDPFGDLGRLQSEMFRAVRLVVDTGIHAQRWTREQAIQYMLDKTGMGDKEVTAEIERYIVSPGQACSYKVGMLKILELRARAQNELGAKWDEREFHDVVLRNGALPLEILEQQVSAYLASKK